MSTPATYFHQIDFERVHGRSGDRMFIPVRLGLSFRAFKLVATSSFDTRTRVCQIYVDGQKTLRPLAGWRRWLLARSYQVRLPRFLARALRGHPCANMPTEAFAPGALGNGLSIPACPAGKEITIEVEFLSAGTWEGSLYGQLDTGGPDERATR